MLLLHLKAQGSWSLTHPVPPLEVTLDNVGGEGEGRAARARGEHTGGGDRDAARRRMWGRAHEGYHIEQGGVEGRVGWSSRGHGYARPTETLRCQLV
jgi:hypothetical protein